MTLYRAAAQERGGDPARTRAEICAAGMVFHHPKRRESWTGASSVIALARAVGTGDGSGAAPRLCARAGGECGDGRAGGAAGAEVSTTSRSAAFLHDWRVLNEWWQPQASEAEAVAVAERQSKELGRLSPRRYEEFAHVREPIFAAWVVTLCPDAAVVEPHRDAILATLAHYDYSPPELFPIFPRRSGVVSTASPRSNVA